MKRKIISLLLIVTLMFSIVSLVACNAGGDGSSDPSDSENNGTGGDGANGSDDAKPSNSSTNKNTSSSSDDITKYQIKKFTQAIWSGSVSYAEAAFVRQNASKGVDPIQLLYDIEEIISVRSSDLKTLYKEGVDYRVTDGKLEIIEGGSIPVLEYDKYYFPMTQADYDADRLATKVPAKKNGWGYIVAEQRSSGDPGMSAWTLAVTYKHEEGNCAVSVPEDKSEKFATLIQRIKNKEKIKVVAIGDSITAGWSSSMNAHMSPNCPNFPGLVNDYIKLMSRGLAPEYVNLAYSGKSSGWALNYCNDRQYVPIDKLCEEDPDLVYIAFGMNDACSVTPSAFVANINSMISTINQKCPDAMIVVVGTMLPNSEVLWSPNGSPILLYHDDYVATLKAAEKNWTNAVFADVTTAHQEIMTVKTYQDTTGSNTNHPNDYFHRVYANVIIQTIFGYQ